MCVCVCVCVCVCMCVCVCVCVYICKETLLAIGFPHDRCSMLDQLPGVSYHIHSFIHQIFILYLV